MLHRPRLGFGRIGQDDTSALDSSALDIGASTLSVDPTLLWAGLGLLVLALLLLSSSGGRKHRRSSRRRRRPRPRSIKGQAGTETRIMPLYRKRSKAGEPASFSYADDEDQTAKSRRRAHREMADLREEF